jgi:hypothetical protein
MSKLSLGCSRNLYGLMLPREPLAPPLNGRDEPAQVHLQRVEDLADVVLSAEPDLALAVARVLDDVLRSALGLLGELVLADQALLALAGLLHD